MTNIGNVTAVKAAEVFRAANNPHREDSVVVGLDLPDPQLLELEQLLAQLRMAADDGLATQGRLRGLLRANAAVTAELTVPAVLRHFVDAARDFLHARCAAFVVLDSDARLQQFVHAGIDPKSVARISSAGDGPAVLDLLTTCPDTAVPTAVSPVVPGNPDGGTRPGGFLGVPIQVGGEVFGNLYLTATPTAIFTVEDEELVTALAATASVAIAHARLLQESEQRRRWLAASGQLTNQLLAADTLQPLTCVGQAAMAAANADFATISVANGTDDMRVVAATGDAAPMDRATALGRRSAAEAIAGGTPVLLVEHRARSVLDDAADTATGPTMLVPLSAGQYGRGVITIGRRCGGAPFTDADLDMAVSFGNHAAVALALAESRDLQISDARLDDHERIAFDMHDHVIGELFAVGMGLQGLATATRDRAQSTRMTRYVDSLDHVISTIRTAVFRLQPRRHDPDGLQSRVLAVADAHAEQLGYPPQLHFTGPLDHVVDDSLAADVLAVTREALSNCARHAHATAVTVCIGVARDLLTVEITDNGAGMGATTRSSGLTNLRRRAEDHGGAFAVSEASGGGTRLIWSAICTTPVAA